MLAQPKISRPKLFLYMSVLQLYLTQAHWREGQNE